MKLLLLSIIFYIPIFAKVSIVVTHPNLKYITDEIGKEKVETFSMIRGFDDPHFVMTRPDFLVRLSKADIFCNIGLDLEIGWAPSLVQQSRNSKIQKGQVGYCDASVGVKILGEPTVMLDRSMGDMHIYGNPHYWLDPVNMIQMAANVLAALNRVDPANGDYYEENYLEFKDKLTKFLKEEMKKFQPYFGIRVAVFHDQFIYLANRFKFTANLTLEERAGVPPSNAYLEQVIETMKAKKIKVILISPYHNKSYAEFVAKNVPDCKVLVMPESIGSLKGIDTYEDSIRESLRLIKEAVDTKK
ncbi:MAG: metal ABC transporter substrate-binding protein [Leptospiraceae bacterium]|nr:metal ABC transporter substrate-binding protein [Leptospiraceae bacterium]